jgi:hypothetical protein
VYHLCPSREELFVILLAAAEGDIEVRILASTLVPVATHPLGY